MTISSSCVYASGDTELFLLGNVPKEETDSNQIQHIKTPNLKKTSIIMLTALVLMIMACVGASLCYINGIVAPTNKFAYDQQNVVLKSDASLNVAASFAQLSKKKHGNGYGGS